VEGGGARFFWVVIVTYLFRETNNQQSFRNPVTSLFIPFF
jgi:hypothetical protein